VLKSSRTGISVFRKSRRLPDTSRTRQGTTTDGLWDGLAGDGLPGDVEVRKDYGFDRCVTLLEEHNLDGLYVGLKEL
jgi:hypothetical protein